MSISAGIKHLLWVLVLGMPLVLLAEPAFADSVAVTCSSPPVTAPDGGGAVTLDINCQINAPDANGAYTITDSSENFLLPPVLQLNQGVNFLTAIRQSPVSSPDGTVHSITGTSSGFTARMSPTDSLQTVRFQYVVNTLGATPAGHYASNAGGAYYHYRICTNPDCNHDIFTGTAPVSLSLDVTTAPVSVTCASPEVNATPGGGPFALTVSCTASGGQPGQFSPAQQNVFSPGVINLFNGSTGLSAVLQPVVTSPDSSFTNITGTAGGGFAGKVSAWPATLQVQYKGTTTNTTPAGTYTSAPVVFAWSTL